MNQTKRVPVSCGRPHQQPASQPTYITPPNKAMENKHAKKAWPHYYYHPQPAPPPPIPPPVPLSLILSSLARSLALPNFSTTPAHNPSIPFFLTSYSLSDKDDSTHKRASDGISLYLSLSTVPTSPHPSIHPTNHHTQRERERDFRAAYRLREKDRNRCLTFCPFPCL